jgi:hypoxia up-regulated 1
MDSGRYVTIKHPHRHANDGILLMDAYSPDCAGTLTQRMHVEITLPTDFETNVVKVLFQFDENSILSVASAKTTREVEIEVPTKTDNETKSEPPPDNSNADADIDPSGAPQPVVDIDTPNKKIIDVDLEVELSMTGVSPLTKRGLSECASRMQAIRDKENRHKKRIAARNAFESFVNEVGDAFLWGIDAEEKQSFFDELELKSLEEMLGILSDWIYDEGQEADIDTLHAKASPLEELIRRAYHRMDVRAKMPSAVSKCRKRMNSTLNAIEAQEKKMPHATDIEVESLTNMVEETLEWITNTLANETARAPHEDPSTDLEDVNDMCKRPLTYLRILERKPKPKIPSPEPSILDEIPDEKPSEEQDKNGDDENENNEIIEPMEED